MTGPGFLLRRYPPRELYAVAAALAAVGAAVWFDFFFTLPYNRLTIRSGDEVTTALLLLVTGLAVSQLAAWARKLKVVAVTGAVALAEQVGQVYNAARVSGSAR
jgi:K+-sensing histidine kinase KdpD